MSWEKWHWRCGRVAVGRKRLTLYRATFGRNAEPKDIASNSLAWIYCSSYWKKSFHSHDYRVYQSSFFVAKLWLCVDYVFLSWVTLQIKAHLQVFAGLEPMLATLFRPATINTGATAKCHAKTVYIRHYDVYRIYIPPAEFFLWWKCWYLSVNQSPGHGIKLHPVIWNVSAIWNYLSTMLWKPKSWSWLICNAFP